MVLEEGGAPIPAHLVCGGPLVSCCFAQLSCPVIPPEAAARKPEVTGLWPGKGPELGCCLSCSLRGLGWLSRPSLGMTGHTQAIDLEIAGSWAGGNPVAFPTA